MINHTAPVGSHNVTVDYLGDKNHNPSNNTTTFEVVRQDPNINATIDARSNCYIEKGGRRKTGNI